ncbi:MAG: ribonuclease HII [Patescibacteria group bacterium]
MIKYIIGIDEAGRGPLAGPIVAAAVLSTNSSKERKILSLADDSKKLSSKKREHLFLMIIKNIAWSVRALDNTFIDKYGIQTANILLFHELSQDFTKQVKGEVNILADYVGGADKILRHINFYKQGESQYQEIAAASIIAKVYRDRLMMSLDKIFPHYDFCLHKGYGTKKHYENINKFGLSPIHRRSFLKNYNIS